LLFTVAVSRIKAIENTEEANRSIAKLDDD